MNFDEIIDRRSSESLKWHAYDDDVLPLWVADMDFRCPEPVIEALQTRVAHGILGYGLPPQDLSAIIVARMKELYDWEILEEEVSYVPGCVPGFNLAMRVICKPGESVIIQTPVYPPFLTGPTSARLTRVDNCLIKHEDGFYEVDYAAFEAQIIDNKVKMFILCNPHNPVGRVFRHDELSRMAEICLANNVLICSDEIHCDLIFSGHRHIPIASLNAAIAANTITLIAPSKTFNIAGLHTSVAIIQNPEVRELYKSARQGVVSNPGLLGFTAARAAYLHGEKWLQEVLAYLEGNRDWLVAAVQERLPGIRMFRPEGTYLAWLNCSALNLLPCPCQFFLEKARVGLNDGQAFGPGGKDFVRLNFASPRSMLEEAISRMHHALKTEGLI